MQSNDPAPNFGPDLDELNHRAFNRLAPVVETIVRTQDKRKQRISRTLDQLLRYCGHPDNLRLYRKLCRYLRTLDPGAARYWANAYSMTWGLDA